jgi:hypothetical protein
MQYESTSYYFCRNFLICVIFWRVAQRTHIEMVTSVRPSLCTRVRPSVLCPYAHSLHENRWSHFGEIRLENYAILGNRKFVVFNFLQWIIAT